METLDPNGPLMIQVTKLYNSEDMSSFSAYGRIYSGRIKRGQFVHVLGESYSPDDDEDKQRKPVEAVSLFESRYKIEVESAGPGNWVLIQGLDGSIMKTATIVGDAFDTEETLIFKPLTIPSKSVMKLAIEPRTFLYGFSSLPNLQSIRVNCPRCSTPFGL